MLRAAVTAWVLSLAGMSALYAAVTALHALARAARRRRVRTASRAVGSLPAEPAIGHVEQRPAA